ncbi:unnamed protein product [Owenia fusiformis]|uniref:Uncharacterized protein n=1 Tax=Owenia fusiformis TaxID=6347 RepID=A0A8J1U662_OWEFU|nr:unnamed protein product [Owenia fusiformis]
MPVVSSRTTTVTSHSTGTAVHAISFRGLAGGIFFCIAIALVLYVVGFSTTAWIVTRYDDEGLWERCRCDLNGRDDGWFRATQAMICIGLLGLIISLICIFIYMCVHSVSKNQTLLALTIVCFITVAFMAIGFVVFGANVKSNVSWSFVLCVVGGIFTLIAGILSAVQMRQSGVSV